MKYLILEQSKLLIDSQPIPLSNSGKVLELRFDSSHSWLPHIKEIEAKSLRSPNVFKYLTPLQVAIERYSFPCISPSSALSRLRRSNLRPHPPVLTSLSLTLSKTLPSAFVPEPSALAQFYVCALSQATPRFIIVASRSPPTS